MRRYILFILIAGCGPNAGYATQSAGLALLHGSQAYQQAYRPPPPMYIPYIPPRTCTTYGNITSCF